TPSGTGARATVADLTSRPGGLVMNRREFLETVVAAAVLPGLVREDADEWGAPVFDLHFHLRPQPAANLAHLDGAGIAKANLLTRGRVLDQVTRLHATAPGRFT